MHAPWIPGPVDVYAPLRMCKINIVFFHSTWFFLLMNECFLYLFCYHFFAKYGLVVSGGIKVQGAQGINRWNKIWLHLWTELHANLQSVVMFILWRYIHPFYTVPFSKRFHIKYWSIGLAFCLLSLSKLETMRVYHENCLVHCGLGHCLQGSI